MLMLHSDWWEQLSHDDHELLHALPQPHGPVFAWLERQLADHGPMSWAEIEQAQAAAEPALPAEARVPPAALEDDMEFADLRRVVDGLWIERLSLRQSELIARASTDAAALQQWREVTRRRDALLKAVATPQSPELPLR